MNSKSVSTPLRFLKGSLNFWTSTLLLATSGIFYASMPWSVKSLSPFKQERVGFSNLPQRMTFICLFMLTCLLSMVPSSLILFSVLSAFKSSSSGMRLRSKCEIRFPFFLGNWTGAFTIIKNVEVSYGPRLQSTDFSIVRVYGFSIHQHLSKFSELVAFSLSTLKGRSSSTYAVKI